MLSIIVPIYNVKHYLRECIHSLITQEFKNCEIILVDDGSTDGSAQICDEFQKKDSRIKVIHQSNGGLSFARNTGLREARGKYISFIDSDDIVTPVMFTDLIEKIEKYDADVAICNFEVFNRENRYKGDRYKDEVIDYSPSNQVKFFGAALDSSCNRVYKADPIRRFGLEFEHKSKVAQEDYWFLVRLFAHISRIVTVSAPHYIYRERGSSITKSHSDGDITKRCLEFLALSQSYLSANTDRSYNDFISFQFVNMFMASINNASDTRRRTIEAIVRSFMRVPIFFEAISKECLKTALPGSGMKHQYDLLCFALLRLRLTKVYSFLESIRLKKLRSKNRTTIYFD